MRLRRVLLGKQNRLKETIRLESDDSVAPDWGTVIRAIRRMDLDTAAALLSPNTGMQEQ
jgi:hypothetical protein